MTFTVNHSSSDTKSTSEPSFHDSRAQTISRASLISKAPSHTDLQHTLLTCAPYSGLKERHYMAKELHVYILTWRSIFSEDVIHCEAFMVF